MSTNKVKSISVSLFANALRATKPAVKALFEGSSLVYETLLEEGAEACDAQALRLKAKGKGRKKALKELGFGSEKEFKKSMYVKMVEAEQAEAKKGLEMDLKKAALPECRVWAVEVEEEKEETSVSEEEVEVAVKAAFSLLEKEVEKEFRYKENPVRNEKAEERLHAEAVDLVDNFLKKGEFSRDVNMPYIGHDKDGPIHISAHIYKNQLVKELAIKAYEAENNIVN